MENSLFWPEDIHYTFIFILLNSTQSSHKLETLSSFSSSCVRCVFFTLCVCAVAWLKDYSSSRGPHR